MNSTLKDWLTIGISVIALFISIVNMVNNLKSNKSSKEDRIQKSDFEKYKEIVRQQEKKNDDIMLELSRRATLVPYFQLLLDNSKINFKKDIIILEISLINVGKESATNLMLYPIDEQQGMKIYCKTMYKEKNNHFVYDYLNQYYACPREKVSFSIQRAYKESDGQVGDFIEFKIRFNDLIGNLYEQKFRFGYDNYLLKGFNLDNTSYLPNIIEDK